MAGASGADVEKPSVVCGRVGVGRTRMGIASGWVVAGRSGEGDRANGTFARGPIGDRGPLKRGDVGPLSRGDVGPSLRVRTGEGDLLRIRKGAEAESGVGDPERTVLSAERPNVDVFILTGCSEIRFRFPVLKFFSSDCHWCRLSRGRFDMPCRERVRLRLGSARRSRHGAMCRQDPIQG